MANEHRKLGSCIEVYPKEGGWVVQQVTVTTDPEAPSHLLVETQVLRAGIDTHEDATLLAANKELPVFTLSRDPDAA